MSRLGRRRTIAVLAAACGLPLPAAGAARVPTWSWRGEALGAAAQIRLAHPDRETASHLVAGCVAELRRLEAAFSLYRADSELSRLNRDGALAAPSRDFVALMRLAHEWGERSGGAFDATVQPLWRLYADHFARLPGDSAGPSAAAREAASAAVDHRAVEIAAQRIAFARPGMAVTLNGIAQGYITDRVADRLRDSGIESTLVEMGEIAAIGRRPDGAPWTVEIPDGSDGVAARLALQDRAVATSAGRATPFEPTRRFHHLFDPRTGSCAGEFAAVSVVAPRATTADALSTALFVTPRDRAAELLRRACAPADACDVLLQDSDGSLVHLSTGRTTGTSPFATTSRGDKP